MPKFYWSCLTGLTHFANSVYLHICVWFYRLLSPCVWKLGRNTYIHETTSFSYPGISVNELSPLSLRRWNIRHFKFDFHRLKMADSLLLEEVTSPRKRELFSTICSDSVELVFICSSHFVPFFTLFDWFIKSFYTHTNICHLPRMY